MIRIRDLTIALPGRAGDVRPVDGVNLHVEAGETLGLVGESGCGKSLTALAVLRLVPPPLRIVSGSVLFEGTDLLTLSERALRRVRGRGIGLVFQEPSAALNPVFTVGYQIAEGLFVHKMMTKKEALREAVRLMEMVRIPDAARRARDYPHQLSGGMRQRVMIAMALACRPRLLIADEPTTALDVTLQADILDLLASLKRDLGLSLLLITHNLGVIAETADRVAVMYAGRIVEEAPVADLFRAAQHPYTTALLRSVPRIGEAGAAAGGPRRRLPAIDGSVPDPADLPSGCAFHPRCPEVVAECRAQVPALRTLSPGRAVACVRRGPAGGGAA